MSYKNRLLFYQTITPLHVGCGQDVGVVDLPVIRERTTGYPFIPGSGIRGSLRDVFRRLLPREEVSLLFGPDAEESETGPRYAGCVAVHDARILLFPVRSDQTPFVWITCPAVLERFSRDTGFLLDGAGWTVEPGKAPGEDEVAGPFNDQVHLEEFEMTVRAGGAPESLSALLAKLAGPLAVPELAQRVALVSNQTFHYLVTHATQILQHNRLTAAKTVADGQLFSVEAVPPETVFYGFLGATDPRRPKAERKENEVKNEESADTIRTREEALAALAAPFSSAHGHAHLQLGGDEGTGLGITRLAWAEAPEAGHAS